MQRENISEKILNLSRDKLSELFDLPVSFLYKIESGKKNVGLSVLLKIADALYISLE